MRKVMFGLIISCLSLNSMAAECPALLNVTMQKLRSSESLDLCKLAQGKVVLAVNTASNCGFTPQFKGLEALYKKYQAQGLVVLGFPSDDFKQEFEDAEKTAKVCYINYGVTFPMFSKTAVTGNNANPFFARLIKMTGHEPKWNFNKYLINRKADQVTAFESTTTPEQLEAQIEKLLAE